MGNDSVQIVGGRCLVYVVSRHLLLVGGQLITPLLVDDPLGVHHPDLLHERVFSKNLSALEIIVFAVGHQGQGGGARMGARGPRGKGGGGGVS